MAARHTRRAFGLTILKNSHPTIRMLQRDNVVPSIHGHKFWRSSFLLMDYLKHYPPAQKRPRVLELGCGWGLAGIYCARKFNAKVTGLDADPEVFPYLELHAEINGVKLKTLKRKFERVKKDELAKFDLIIGADICFWDSLTDSLFKLIRRARKGGSPRVVLADPGRPTFTELAERCEDQFGDDSEFFTWHARQPKSTRGVMIDIGG